MYYPNHIRIDFYSTYERDKLVVEATHANKIWTGRALRLTPGRVLRSPEDSTSDVPKVEEVVYRESTYELLYQKFKEFFQLEIGEDVHVRSLDSNDVHERVIDWKKRVDQLYESVTQEIVGLYEVSKQDAVEMNEEMMQMFHLKPTTLPVLRVSSAGKLLLLFKPKGLWIVGANGRVDLITPKSALFLVDDSKFKTASNWVQYDSKRSVSRPFNKNLLLEILENECD